MTDLRIQCFALETTDPDRLAGFWAAALGWRRTHDTPDEVVLEPAAGSPEDGVAPDLLFLKVPQGKQTKNRWHPDLRPRDQAAEVERLEGLGARQVDVGQGEDASWTVMADPDGNEFCVLRAYTTDELTQFAAEESPDNASTARAFLRLLEARDWDGWAALMREDVVYDMPQTRERIHGRAAYLEFNRTYPGEWHLDPKVVLADGDHGVAWFAWTLDGEAGHESGDAQAFFDFDDAGLVTRVTDFWPEPYSPPERPPGLIGPMDGGPGDGS